MDYMAMAAQIAREYGIDPEIFVRQMVQESNFNPDAVSPKGAVGIAQIMPDTARDPGYGIQPISDRTDPEASLRFGAQYMRAMLDEYGGDYGLALAAYNAGPGTVNKAGGIPPIAETQNYVQSILGGAGMPDASGLSMGRPTGTLPSEDLMMGIPQDPERMSLMEMVQPLTRAQATPEQLQGLAETMMMNEQSMGRGLTPNPEGILALPQTDTRMAWQ